MIPKKVLSKSFLVAAFGSMILHLVFAMTAGAYFLTQESPPEKNQVRVQIIEKEKPDREKKKERKVKPVLKVVPVIQPIDITQPKLPQQVVQVASLQTKVDVQPVMMESIPTSSAPPKNAQVTSHVSSRAMTASTSTPRPMRTTAVATVASSSNTVKRRTSNVSAYTAPNVTPVMKPTTNARPVMTSSRTSMKRGRTVSRRASAPAPMAVASSSPARSGTRGTALKRSNATRVASTIGSARAISPTSKPGSGGSSGVGLKQSSARSMRMAGLTAFTPSPVTVIPPKPPEPVKVIEEVIEEVMDAEALKGYQRKLFRRLTYVAKKNYKRSRAKKSRQEGKVQISITLKRDGSIEKVFVKTPNQFASINQVAMEAVKKAAPFAEFPDGVVGNELTWVVPFKFELR